MFFARDPESNFCMCSASQLDGPDEIKGNRIAVRPLHVSRILLMSFPQILFSVLYPKQGR